MQKHRCTAIMLAAGKGLRVGGDTSKQYLEIGGAPLLIHSVRTMSRHERITDMIVLCPAGDEDMVRGLLERYSLTEKLRLVLAGGFERFHSVHLGLEAIDWECDYVFIHDCARPFLDEKTIDRLYETVLEDQACVAGMPSKDTVKIADTDGFVTQTPNRSEVWIIQTPQVFAFELIREAHRRLMRQLEDLCAQGVTITDDAMVAERMMQARVRLVEASYWNIKVTTPEDLVVAEAMFRGAGDSW